MTIRDATPADKELLLTLVDEFESELPPLPYADDTPEEDWERIEKRIHEGVESESHWRGANTEDCEENTHDFF